MRIAVCDDEINVVNQVTEWVKMYAAQHLELDISVQSFSNAADLAAVLQATAPFDLYLLDVMMPELDGIALGKSIRAMNQTAIILYLTNLETRALDAYGVRAFNYLLKPLKRERLFAELDLAFVALERNKTEFFSLKTREGLVAFPIHTIMYGEMRGHVLTIQLIDGRTVESVTLRIAMIDVLAPVLKDDNFVKTHKSFVVNLAYVEKLETRKLQMRDGHVVPIAQGNYVKVKQHYMKYLLETKQ